MSTRSLHETLTLVDGIVKQPTQYTNSGVPDVFWAREVEASGGNLRSSPPVLPDNFHSLSETMKRRREGKLLCIHSDILHLSLVFNMIMLYNHALSCCRRRDSEQ